MIKKAIRLYQTSPFLKDSSLLFVINILASLFNFALQPFASRILQNQFDLWTSVNSLSTIFLTLIAGISTEIVKNTSILAEKNPKLPFEYYKFTRKKILYLTLISLLFIPVLSFPLNSIIKADNIWLIAITLFYLFLVAYTGLNRNFLLGFLAIKPYGISVVCSTFLRFLTTIFFLYLGLGVFALPVGFLLANILSFLLTEFLVQKEKDKIYDHHKKIVVEHEFDFYEIFAGFFKTGLILFGLSCFFLLSPIVSRSILDSDSERNLFAVLVFFGQIIFFGTVSFFTGLISHLSKSKDRQIYFASIFLVISLSLAIGVGLWFFGPFLLFLLDKSEYQDQLPLILLYTIFIGFYNVVYVSIQYLIARNKNKLSMAIFASVLALIAGLWLIDKNLLYFDFGGKVFAIILLNIIIAMLTAVFFTYKIISEKI